MGAIAETLEEVKTEVRERTDHPVFSNGTGQSQRTTRNWTSTGTSTKLGL